jgi:hypothetical protein
MHETAENMQADDASKKTNSLSPAVFMIRIRTGRSCNKNGVSEKASCSATRSFHHLFICLPS